MYLAKACSKVEINLSVVHWVRKELNINLPEFFDRFQDDLAKKDTELDGVNFNSEGTGEDSWRAPMLGQSKKALTKYTTPSCIIPVNWAVLSPEWEKIIDNRNAGAHEPVVKECVVKEIKDALDTLISKGVFDQLHKIKTDLREKTPVPSVHVPDKKLREAIAKELKLAITGKNIPAKDMARLGVHSGRSTLHAPCCGIKELTGLGRAKGLRKLLLANNEIEDLTALKDLTALVSLDLANNEIEDLTALKDLTALVSLDLENNKIKDLEALKKLKNLKSLKLKGNCINESKQKTTLDTLKSRGCKVSL